MLSPFDSMWYSRAYLGLGLSLVCVYVAFGVRESFYAQTWSTTANVTMTGSKVAWNAATTSGWEPASIASLSFYLLAPIVGVMMKWYLEPKDNVASKASLISIISALTCFSVAFFAAEINTAWKSTVSFNDPLLQASVILYVVHVVFALISVVVVIMYDAPDDNDHVTPMTSPAFLSLSMIFLVASDLTAQQPFYLNNNITQAAVGAFVAMNTISIFCAAVVFLASVVGDKTSWPCSS